MGEPGLLAVAPARMSSPATANFGRAQNLGEGSWPARRRRFALHFAGADAELPSSPAVGCCGHGARQRKVSFAGEAQEPA